MSDANKIIIFKHSRAWSEDRCSRLLLDKGYEIDWCYPQENDDLPEPENYRAAVMFGCRDSVNDNEPWIKAEQRWLEKCLKADCPYLGICFGGQMLAKVLGARVAKHEENLTEIGFIDIKPTGSALDGQAMPPKLFQWHREGFELPSGTTLLCSSERFFNQGFRYDNRFYGLQFHPEVNQPIIAQWLSQSDDFEAEGLDAASRQQHLNYARQHDDAITEWFSGFIDNWLD